MIATVLEAASNLDMLDAPMLFTKRHSYQGIHIYDTYYQWWPGGGIYVLENPLAPRQEQRIRAVIDATTPGTLGEGVYSDPELSWDATKLLFSFKGEKDGNTCIYEIGIDGTGLRRLTDAASYASPCGRYMSQHDIGAAYLPDGRIVFTSTRLNGLVPCNNTGVDILHVMNADGSDLHAISVNNVNEFDPAVLPDGRILFGRWEYVDKTALTQQSLWTIFPDGSNETAFYANNLVIPEAFLGTRPVPGSSHLVASCLAKHNSTPRGTIAFVDVYVDKNDPAAITNLDHPDNPTVDTGDSCDPWPLSQDVILYSGRVSGAKRNVIMIADRSGTREIVLADPDICLYSPMLVKPREVPPIIDRQTIPGAKTGAFFVQDIYRGLTGVQRGEIKQLRVIEETSRITGTHGAEYNQQFLLSAALAFSAKIYMGVVPVEEDGSAYFEVPSGRAIYLQALDADGRLVQSMRTFVQAAPGVVRSCVGCHEHKYSAAENIGNKRILQGKPGKLQPESWGSGYVDYPSMVQPIFDKHCVSCHGGENGFGNGLDLSGGWTDHFNISYQNLVNRRNNQLTATLISGIDCMNGTALWSAQKFEPRAHGSGNAPLADVLVSGHKGRIENLSLKERDLILAWIDSNGLYHGSWDYAEGGVRLKAYNVVKEGLTREMRSAGCMSCHEQNGRFVFEEDWFNLKEPRMSRILRAPLAKGGDGYGVEACRDHKRKPGKQRIRMYFTGGYVHHVLPLESFKPVEFEYPDTSGVGHVSFASTADERYQRMLAIINSGRRAALAEPRTDMPGAKLVAGASKQTIPLDPPAVAPAMAVRAQGDGIVMVTWERAADTIGLSFDLYRSDKPDFVPGRENRVCSTQLFRYEDFNADAGRQYYALVASSNGHKSRPAYAAVDVPMEISVPVPQAVKGKPLPGEVQLTWDEHDDVNIRYNVYRAAVGSNEFVRLNDKPLGAAGCSDTGLDSQISYRYIVRSVNRKGTESVAADEIVCRALPERREAVFAVDFSNGLKGTLLDAPCDGVAAGSAKAADGALDLTNGGHVTLPYSSQFDLTGKLTVECRVRLDSVDQMPVIVSCGSWNDRGWFLQKLGGTFRWHAGGVDCDGGKAAAGKWTHLMCVYDGRAASLYQDGKRVASVPCVPNQAAWGGPLFIGQYSGGVGEAYQVKGAISEVNIYRRAIGAKEAMEKFEASR
ncbi:MAG: hypothetical protein IH624_00215 [Phycisphaerae bacterium]|nr:hypothetical protein [Phycisphaerae bacterium]